MKVSTKVSTNLPLPPLTVEYLARAQDALSARFAETNNGREAAYLLTAFYKFLGSSRNLPA